jgi:hypothetical protein
MNKKLYHTERRQGNMREEKEKEKKENRTLKPH